jgi:hypothetical protein
MSRPLAVANYNNKISHTDQAWTGEINGFLFDVFANGQLSVASDPLFDFGTGDFTVELTVGQANNGITLIDFRDSTGQDRLRVDLAANDYIKVYKGETLLLTSSVSVPGSFERVLPHVAVTRASGVIKIWIEGVEQGSVSDLTDFTQGPISIAASYNRSTQFDGTFGEVRVSTVARYTSNFTQPTTAHVDDGDTSLLLHADGPNFSTSIVDDASYVPPVYVARTPVTITAFDGAQVDTSQAVFGGASAVFDGIDDYIQADDSDGSWVFGTSNDFTIEFWYKLDNTTDTSRLASNRGGYTTGNWYIQYANNQIQWGVSGIAAQTTPATFDDTNWHHIALVRVGTTFTMYVDGVNESSITATLQVGRAGDPYIRLGRIATLSEGPKNMDEFRVSNTARYTSNFTPAVVPHINDDDTLLLLHMDGEDGATTIVHDDSVGRPVKVTA